MSGDDGRQFSPRLLWAILAVLLAASALLTMLDVDLTVGTRPPIEEAAERWLDDLRDD